MRVVAVTMVKDEDDILPYTVRHLLQQGVDSILIADNLSATPVKELLCGIDLRKVEVVIDPDPAYRQAAKMSKLAELAAETGDWVIPFDADEAWSHINKLRDLDADVAPSKPYVHIPNISSDQGQNPLRKWCHRMMEPERMPKVAFKWRPGCRLHMGNHDVDGAGPRRAWDVLDIRHFQYRTLAQVRRKVENGCRAFDALEGASPIYGSHWRDLNARGDALSDWWDTYLAQPVTFDPVPGIVR